MSVASDISTSSLPACLSSPVYRFDRTFEQNAAEGPAFTGPYPAVPATPMKDFFGYPVASRIGMAASLLVNERWFELYSRLGFDILTYKTIRSQRRVAHAVPNWLFADDTTSSFDPSAPLRATNRVPSDPLLKTAVGSIGMPSSPPELWRRDIRACRARLRPGQVFIVSVVGTANAETNETAFIDDYSQLAAEAQDAGAQVVELNFSCPNVGKRESEVYLDPAMAERIAKAVRATIGSLPLVVKVGAIDDPRHMTELLRRLAGTVDGVVMINAPSRTVLDHGGAFAFGEGRIRAGMMGDAVFDIAMTCVRNAVDIVQRDNLDLRILAVGGVTSAERIKAFLDAGAYAALAASAGVWDPYLAIRAKAQYPSL